MPTDRNEPESESAALEASDWVGRRDRGLTPREEAEFSRWLAADPSHGQTLAEFEATWSELDLLRAFRPAGAAAPEADLPLPSKRRRRARLIQAAWLAAAALAMSMATWRWLPVPPSAMAEPRKMELADGSVVELNTGGIVEVEFTAAERRVWLVRGEAHFTVVKNPARPFIVSADKVSVRAVGTAFDVRLGSKVVEVIVTEGKVQVDDALHGRSVLPATGERTRISLAAGLAPAGAASPPLLVAGERAEIPLLPGPEPAIASVSPVAKAEMTRALAWRQGYLNFGPASLADVVAEFNRHNSHQIVIADPRIGRLRIGGTFCPDDDEAFVRLLETYFGIKAERGKFQTVLRGSN